jgi:hypothetical protein
MDDVTKAELLEESYQIIEHELIVSNAEQQNQLRLVHRQRLRLRRFKETGKCGRIKFSELFQQSVLLVLKLMAEIFRHQS